MLRKPTQFDLDYLIRRTRRRFDRLAVQYAEGDINAPAFGLAMQAILSDRHARAAYYGRRRAGDAAPFGEEDELYGAIVAESEGVFVAKFVADLAAGKYVDAEGNLSVTRIKKRARLYSDRITGTANETFAGVSDAPITWHLGEAEEHCPDCPELAAGSPYTWQTLPTTPGSNDTACLFNCKCYLTIAGKRGFDRTPH